MKWKSNTPTIRKFGLQPRMTLTMIQQFWQNQTTTAFTEPNFPARRSGRNILASMFKCKSYEHVRRTLLSCLHDPNCSRREKTWFYSRLRFIWLPVAIYALQERVGGSQRTWLNSTWIKHHREHFRLNRVRQIFHQPRCLFNDEDNHSHHLTLQITHCAFHCHLLHAFINQISVNIERVKAYSYVLVFSSLRFFFNGSQ